MLLRDLITIGADLHAISRDNYWPGREKENTPFLHMITPARYWIMDLDGLIEMKLDFWLEALQSAGVDLLQYGRVEKSILDRLPWRSKEFTIIKNGKVKEYRVVGFTYGASRRDWRIWVSEPSNNRVGERQSMIQGPKEHKEDKVAVPGMWVE